MNSEHREDRPQPHTLSLRERKVLEMRGVTAVISFDEDTVELSTVCGELTVEGEGLHIKVLNLAEGVVSMDGTVTSLTYTQSGTEKPASRGLFGRRGR